MLNFIVAGEIYEFFENMHGTETFSVSRLFESTSEEIRNKLLPLDQDALDYLEMMPVLFLTEPEIDDSGSFETSLIRIGSISNLEIVKDRKETNIKFDFSIKRDLGRCQLKSVKSYSRKLGLGGFGLHRTHWSVKKTTLKEALDLIMEKHSESSRLHSGVWGADKIPEIDFDVHLGHEDNEEIIRDVNDYLKKILEHTFDDDEEIFYRGHSDYRYKLTPSVFRIDKLSNYLYKQYESEMINELLTVQPAEFMNDKYMLDKLVRMQHYGLPTRLLDVTTNPLIALYFACSTSRKEKNEITGEETEIDGNVIVMTTKKKHVKFFDSDTVSCISNLSRLPEAVKKELNYRQDSELFNSTVGCAQLLHLIKDEKPHFKDNIKPEDLQRIIVVKGKMSNPRINSQSGAFLIFGEDAVLPEFGHSEIKIRKFRIQDKSNLMEQLSRFGINESTVYPGIEKAAGEIAKKYAKLNKTQADIA